MTIKQPQDPKNREATENTEISEYPTFQVAYPSSSVPSAIPWCEMRHAGCEKRAGHVVATPNKPNLAAGGCDWGLEIADWGFADAECTEIRGTVRLTNPIDLFWLHSRWLPCGQDAVAGESGLPVRDTRYQIRDTRPECGCCAKQSQFPQSLGRKCRFRQKTKPI